MGLSPSILFHFTNKKGLMGILKDNFMIKYCKENVFHKDDTMIAIPMVSFCDIKISEIKDHISKYGSYGIGLSKIWAIEKGLNPVIYINHDSHFAKSLIESINDLWEIESIPIIKRYNLVDVLRYIKTYEGLLMRNGEKIENYRFADEREWRYVPKMNANNIFDDYLTSDDIKNANWKSIHNKKLMKERLYFNANEILYLVVKEDKDIEEIISHIRSKNYSLQEVERLMTRIISCERIFNDF